MKDKVTLYIATHNQTGLKYFGKTTKYFTEKNLQENYHGSGLRWLRHLKKHGDDVTMEIYQICSLNENDEDYVKPIALKFSEENNIVDDYVKWANLKEEDGLLGGSDKGENNPNFGVPKSEEHKEKIRQKSLNRKHTEETKQKMRAPKQKICCLNCKKEISVNNFHRHIEPCLRPKKELIDQSGENNPRALKVNIYDSENNLVYECRGTFVSLCKENGMPYGEFLNSYKTNGTPIFQNLNKRQTTVLSKSGKIKYKGWYALIIN